MALYHILSRGQYDHGSARLPLQLHSVEDSTRWVELQWEVEWVGYVEQQIREQYTGFIPQLHKRYVDDIVGAASCQRDELENFIDFVSNFHPALQFTSTITETELSFLDITLRISEDRIQTSIFYKETDTHN